MKTKLSMLVVMLAVMSIAIAPMTAMGFGLAGDDYEIEIDSAWTDLPPTLDGDITADEYDNATVVSFDFYPDPPHRNDTIYIYFMNDADFLYIAVDLLPDNSSDDGDYCFLAFDEDDNDEFEEADPDNEDWYVISVETSVTRTETSGLVAYPYGSNDFLFGADYTTTVNDGTVKHRVWEFAIPISNFAEGDLDLGDTVGFSACGYGTLAPTWTYPINYTDDDPDDATNWTKLTLAEAPSVVVVSGWTQYDYAMVILIISLIISLLMLVGWTKMQEYIAEGDEKYVWLIFGINALFIFFGLLQVYWNWVGDLASAFGL